MNYYTKCEHPSAQEIRPVKWCPTCGAILKPDESKWEHASIYLGSELLFNVGKLLFSPPVKKKFLRSSKKHV